MDKFLAVQTLIIVLLLIVSLVAIAVRRLRVPYTVALVVVGLLITFQQPLEISLTPELILSLFVPPLVFEAAFHLEFKSLRENWLPILGLAVPGVLLTTFIVGIIVAVGLQVSLLSALVFGALISATDPVAVVALFRSLGVPQRLSVLIEAESLLNDGTAIVIFQIMLAAALAATAAPGAAPVEGGFDVLAATVGFVRVSAGGLGIGIACGWLIAQITARVDDYLVETTLTTVLAFGTYLIAERLHVSGVLAVVAAGVLMGNFGLRNMSPTTRIVLFNFWEYLAFVTNSLVFLLIGSEVNLRQVLSYLLPISVAIIGILAARAIVVYGLTALTNLRGNPLPIAYQHVLYWGGLRGAISLALVLSLPAAFPDRDLMRVLTFGVVLFTLLVQGTTMQFLIRRLDGGREQELEHEYERRHARTVVANSALKRIKQLYQDGVISVDTWEQLEDSLQEQIEIALGFERELVRAYPNLQAAEREDAELEGLRAKRAALAGLLKDGIISEIISDELIAEVDAAIAKINTAKIR